MARVAWPWLLTWMLALHVFAAAGHAQELGRLRAAAAAGEPAALFTLAEAHEQGDGVEQDLRTAVELYRLAAERGHPEAQYRLGLALSGGFGGPRDPARGLVWLTLAAASGGDAAPLASALRDAVAARQDALTLARVEHRVVAFRSREGPARLPWKAIGSDDPFARVRASLPADHCGPLREARGQVGRGQVGRGQAGRHRIEAFVEIDADAAAAPTRPIDRELLLSVLALGPDLCATLRLLDEAGVIDPELAPMLRDGDLGPRARFVEGDYLVIEIPPQERAGRVAIDYVGHDGNVLHMLPQPGHVTATAGQTLVLGAAGTVPRWQVSQPFGDDLLVVWWSVEPPPGARRPQVETVDEYLRALRAALSADSPVRAGFQIVHTGPRPAPGREQP